MRIVRRLALPALIIAVALALTACESVSISRVLRDPSRWSGRDVHIHGTVTNSFGALGHGAYQVDDGTGTIWVISGTGVPSKGSRVDVVGSVFQGANVGGQAVGTAIREYQHKVKGRY